MPIIQVNHVMNYLDQEMMNRYFYRTALTPNVPIIDELLAEFEAEIVPLVNAMQHSACLNVRLDGIAIEDIFFSTLSLSGTGVWAGQPSPSYNAFSFLLQRSNASTKSGGKRIGGLSEDVMVGNFRWVDASIIVPCDNYAEALDDVLTTTSGTFSPVLVKFDPLNPGVVLADQLIASASYSRLTTQNTRKGG